MIEERPAYGFKLELEGEFSASVSRVREALSAEGFSTLSDTDLAADGLVGDGLSQFRLFAVGTPALIRQAVQTEPDAALLLPARIAVRHDPSVNKTLVTFMDPVTVLALTNNPDVTSIAWSERGRLEQLRDRLSAPDS